MRRLALLAAVIMLVFGGAVPDSPAVGATEWPDWDPTVEFLEQCWQGSHELVIRPNSHGTGSVDISVSLGVAPAFELTLAPLDPPILLNLPQGASGSGSVYRIPEGGNAYELASWTSGECIPEPGDGYWLETVPCQEDPCSDRWVYFPSETPFFIESGFVFSEEELFDWALPVFVDSETTFTLLADGQGLRGTETTVDVGKDWLRSTRYSWPDGAIGLHYFDAYWYLGGELVAEDHFYANFSFSGPFHDDDGSTFEADIEWIASEGITKGCNPPTNDRYCPNDFVTRGQMAAFIHRALGDVLSPTEPVEFIDDNGHTFENDIEWLGATGVTKGCNPPTNDRYCPNDFVTRGQMAAFLVRALGYTDNGGGNLFIDDDGNTFEADIDKLATAGVTKGCNPPANTEYCPSDFVTRGQMAAFLHRALGN